MGSCWLRWAGQQEGAQCLPRVPPTHDHSFQAQGGPCTNSRVNTKEGRGQLGEEEKIEEFLKTSGASCYPIPTLLQLQLMLAHDRPFSALFSSFHFMDFRFTQLLQLRKGIGSPGSPPRWKSFETFKEPNSLPTSLC